jgi:hypothetical protein
MYRLRSLGSLPAAPSNVQAIAQAIATAEGGLTPGSFPYRTNNPCDVFVGGSTAGYSSMDAGWQACYNQINLMLGGGSSVYTPDESISQIAASWAPASAGNDPNAWANNVASALGISPNQPLTAVSGGSVAGSSSSPSQASVAPLSTVASSDNSDSSDSTSSGLDLSTLEFTDDSGNLTTFGWITVAAVAGIGIWAIAG